MLEIEELCDHFDYYDGPNNKVQDNVNHPSHYEKACSLECIEVMKCCFGTEAVYNFCLCNAFKYLWRYKFKNGEEDLKKAKWYVDKAYMLIAEEEELLDSELCERVESLYFEVVEKEKKEDK